MLRYRVRQLPILIATPAIFCMLLILVMDQGNNGIAGFVFNRLYVLLLWANLSGGLLLLSRRLWFSIGLGATLIGGLWIGAAIKYQYLGSQLMAPDLIVAALSAETLLEMGLLPSLLTLAWLLLQSLGFMLEKPATAYSGKIRVQILGGSAIAFMLMNLPAFYVNLQWTTQYKNTLPIFVQSIWRTQLEEPQNPDKASYCCFKANTQAETFTQIPDKKPNIVVILEESTFPPSLLKHFKPSGKFFQDAYPLKVYTVGGATWVQEIAILHGVSPPLYGDGWKSINLFAPGRLDGRIARQLARQGYLTKTIYPIAGRFYGGQRFHEQLGMQDFIDCQAMTECAKRRWNQMPDEIFFNEALRQIRLNDKPLFTFIATMRQHSPHAKEIKADAKRCKPDMNDRQCSIMLDYNARLKLSIDAYEQFTAKLKQLPERTIVVAFGDHIPGDVAAHFTETDFHQQDRQRTFFNVWDSARGYVTHEVLDGMEYETIDVAMLDALTLRYAGFASRYISDKLVHMAECSGEFCATGITGQPDTSALTQLKPLPPSP